MRIIVFFDLPTLTSSDLREYRKFRKTLIKNGFIMMQESVYSKLVLNNTVGDNVREMLRKKKPAKGLVQVLTITEKQFARIEYLQGSCQTTIEDSDKRFIVL